MNTPDNVGNLEKPVDKIEVEVRKPKKGRKAKNKRPEFNLQIVDKDVQIFFN